jgi:hypothetical protein
MRALASWAMYLALLLLAHMFGFGMLGSTRPAAQAQAVPKFLEVGGSDAAQRSIKNSWTVAAAGGQLSGTYMTFANEFAFRFHPDGASSKAVLNIT